MDQYTRVRSRPRYKVVTDGLVKLLEMSARQAREASARNYGDQRFLEIAEECQKLADRASAFSAEQVEF